MQQFSIGDRVRIGPSDSITQATALQETYYSVTGQEHVITGIIPGEAVPGGQWYVLDTPFFSYVGDSLTKVGGDETRDEPPEMRKELQQVQNHDPIAHAKRILALHDPGALAKPKGRIARTGSAATKAIGQAVQTKVRRAKTAGAAMVADTAAKAITAGAATAADRLGLEGVAETLRKPAAADVTREALGLAVTGVANFMGEDAAAGVSLGGVSLADVAAMVHSVNQQTGGAEKHVIEAVKPMLGGLREKAASMLVEALTAPQGALAEGDTTASEKTETAAAAEETQEVGTEDSDEADVIEDTPPKKKKRRKRRTKKG